MPKKVDYDFNQVDLLRKERKSWPEIAEICKASSKDAICTWYNRKKKVEGYTGGITKPVIVTEENGNRIGYNNGEKVFNSFPFGKLKEKLCVAFTYLKRDDNVVKEAITYCLTLVDQHEKV